ncbi:glycine--tRNA ligase subunit beta [Erythrobacter crassostreae]|uniref:Glycine--tRNA ligase beta subunit n=1 Tax=Erythrobacter crassostreae TaxID=2828328 RepID=A0A9X1F4S3_9SPHN|nr:glycine--tRNA ligase subunit beta [Erythrobacter crassostrea]MBV7259956.1 glycine--tRNA ligase subunit beta [Erythrobacter crassostrea]
MADFLLELRSEEIPARMQKGARGELEKLFRREMDAAGVTSGDLTVWSTPRRLALIARGLPTETEAVREEAKGPPVGAPDQAVDGFCRKNGVDRGALEVREVKGRETYFAVIEKPGQAVADLLAAAIPAIIRDFSWPKSMRWGDASVSSESLKWVRPLSGIIALLDGEVVPVVAYGIVSGNVTRGHRFHSAGEIAISGADTYAGNLREASVIVDHEERAAIIREGARKAAEAAGLKLVEDEGLVVENAGLTEWPEPLLGRFEDDFLDVPPETIQLTARVNQKYFVCEDADGNLANAFICTANIDAADPAVVVDGNRKVLAARLSDARFFWELDQKKKLKEHAKGLERITFHEKLGTVADKVERVAKLARWLCEEGIVTDSTVRPEPVEGRNGSEVRTSTSAARTADELADLAEQAAKLCKADLVTEMVGEFPELQGLMGGYYAAKEGLPVEVSDAIRDHYKPVGQGDDVPTAPVTVAVSLADKLDTLVSFFAIDEKPTGSKDPFALRRAAISVLQLLEASDIRLRLAVFIEWFLPIVIDARVESEIVDKVVTDITTVQKVRGGTTEDEIRAYSKQFARDSQLVAEIPSQVEKAFSTIQFFADRLKVQQREAGVRHDLIDAVFALGGEDDLVRLLARVHALQAFVETEDGTNLLAGYKRAANILKKEEWESKEVSYSPEPAEKALIDALDAAEPKAATAIEAEDFAAAMSALATLRAPIDRFFEDVIVNADEPHIRAARLDLLARFRDAVHRVADFSRIEG